MSGDPDDAANSRSVDHSGPQEGPADAESAAKRAVQTSGDQERQSESKNYKTYLVALARGISWQTLVVSSIAGVVSGIITWQVQSYWSGLQKGRDEESRARAAIKATATECARLKSVFRTFYVGYPTLTCEINVYRLPQPDTTLVSYLNERRESIAYFLGDKGSDLIRDASLSAESYKRIFSSSNFRSTISKETTTFDSYFSPLQGMCSKVGVAIEIQSCPY